MTGAPPPAQRWRRRLAQAAFWFFLLKGLLWLSLPVAAWLGWQWQADS